MMFRVKNVKGGVCWSFHSCGLRCSSQLFWLDFLLSQSHVADFSKESRYPVWMMESQFRVLDNVSETLSND
jgi:hypothetical protein